MACSCSWTPTAPTGPRRRSTSPSSSPSIGSAGSRSPSRPTTWPGFTRCASNVPPGMAIAAGEYGYDLPYFERMLEAKSVDVLQADVTRCAGITELLRVDGLCRARSRPLSLHCAPTLHANVGPALETVVHMEYFHDQCGSRGCCSRASRIRATGPCRRMRRGRGWALSFCGPTPSGTQREPLLLAERRALRSVSRL